MSHQAGSHPDLGAGLRDPRDGAEVCGATGLRHCHLLRGVDMKEEVKKDMKFDCNGAFSVSDSAGLHEDVAADLRALRRQ